MQRIQNSDRVLELLNSEFSLFFVGIEARLSKMIRIRRLLGYCINGFLRRKQKGCKWFAHEQLTSTFNL